MTALSPLPRDPERVYIQQDSRRKMVTFVPSPEYWLLCPASPGCTDSSTLGARLHGPIQTRAHCSLRDEMQIARCSTALAADVPQHLAKPRRDIVLVPWNCAYSLFVDISNVVCHAISPVEAAPWWLLCGVCGWKDKVRPPAPSVFWS